MAKKAYPEFHKALLNQSLYPSASRRIKFEETGTSYLYRTGDHLYKIRKDSPVYSSLAIKEAYAHEALRVGERWAPGCYEAVVPIVQTESGYALGGEGEEVAYAVRIKQLSGHYWLSDLLAHGKATQTAIGRLARYLADEHQAHAAPDKAAEVGRPEHLRGLVEEIAYQAKKYIGQTLTDAMYDMTMRPLERFLDEGRKLFLRRQKRDRVVDGHGAFIPEHIYMRGKDVLAVSALETHRKYRLLDAANDVATLLNELNLADAKETADLFLKRYVTASRDRELEKILPVYEAFQAMRRGLVYSERQVDAANAAASEDFARRAHAYFNLAVQRVRELPRNP